GAIEAERLNGGGEFRTESGKVSLRGVSGYVSGNTENGNISIRIIRWLPKDRTVIESIKGHIQLALPSSYSGEVDFCSLHGELDAQLHIEKDENSTQIVGPQPKNRITGRVKDGGELLKVFTDQGDLHVFKGKL